MLSKLSQSKVNAVADFSAGLGDHMSFGLGGLARKTLSQHYGVKFTVDRRSRAYTAGTYTGVAADFIGLARPVVKVGVTGCRYLYDGYKVRKAVRIGKTTLTARGTADSYQYSKLKEHLRLEERLSNPPAPPQPSFQGFPDRKLPTKGQRKLHHPDPEAAYTWHTQLGTRIGENGKKYKQAVEFGSDSKPKRRIDFSDHSRPHEHVNPHQHRLTPMDGGGYKVEDAEPLIRPPSPGNKP